MEYKEYPISELGEVIGGGTPSTKNEEYYNGNISWITPKDLSGYDKRYIGYGSRNISALGLKKSSARLLPRNTVLLTSRAPIGYVAIAEKELSTNQGFKNIICNTDLILPEYLYYYLKVSKDELESVATGSTFKEVSGSTLKNFKIKIPEVKTQKKIINILNKLDAKIENNLQMINNLEQISQTLFKRWFIDLEFPNDEGQPYKSSGGEMAESELVEIPKGWEVKLFSDLMKFASGKRPSIKVTNKEENNPYPIIGASKIMGFTDNYLFDEDILIIGRVGTHGIVQRFNEKIWPSDNTLTIKSDYINLAFQLLNRVDYKSLNRGSTQPLITQKDMSNLKVALPSEMNKLNKFENNLKVYAEMVFNIQNENRKLEQLRDTLLPKLLSGEIEIPDDLEV